MKAIVTGLVAVCLLAFAGGLAQATTTPLEVFNVHVVLTDKGVTFAPAHLTPTTSIVFEFKVTNESRSPRTFALQDVQTPTLAAGHSTSFIHVFHKGGKVTWASSATSGKRFAGSLHVRRTVPVAPMGVPGYQ